MTKAKGYYTLYFLGSAGSHTYNTKGAAIRAAQRSARSQSWVVQVWRHEPPSANIRSYVVAYVHPPRGRVEMRPVPSWAR